MRYVLPFCCLFFIVACTSNDREEPETFEPGHIYQNYQVWGEEGREEVTVRLQFHQGGEQGEAILAPGAGSVYLDDTLLPADSSKFNGVYYEVAVPAGGFRGKHTIRFTNAAGQEYRESFLFDPFSLATELPAELKKVPFDILLKNVPETPMPVRLVMVDTSMESADVNEEVMVEDGRLSITEEFLARLTEGPIYLEIYREEERPVENKAPGGGKILINYALKRQFDLVR